MIMRKLKLYLETSVWNFLFVDDAPEKREVTEFLFQEIESGKYEIYISEIVIGEIDAASPLKQRMLLKAVNMYRPIALGVTDTSRILVQHYLRNEMLSEKQLADLGHVAVATISEMDMLVSWNMRHIVKRKTRIMVNALNQLYGYGPLEICTPEEVIYNEETS
jgi:hypothetical protein